MLSFPSLEIQTYVMSVILTADRPSEVWNKIAEVVTQLEGKVNYPDY